MNKEVVKIYIWHIVYVITAFLFGCNDDKVTQHYTYTTSWYESNVQINYQNGIVDTILIDVYERPDNIKIEYGNLSYWKSTKETGGTVARVIELASYVRSYKVLHSELKMKTEQ